MARGNKQWSLRCVRVAQAAIASGNKEFIKMAQRLDSNLSVAVLLSACERIALRESESRMPEKCVGGGGRCLNGERNYTEEHVRLIREIKRNQDYYKILSVERTRSAEEIRKAYRKLSSKVHPDKNKAPGSEEAFKELCKAFKCLSDDSSRRQYDQVGSLSGQKDTFQKTNVHMTRAMGTQKRVEEFFHGGGPDLAILFLMISFLLILLLAYTPSSPDPDYSLNRNCHYQIPKTTERHDFKFYVKPSSFDEDFPLGSSARAGIEDKVIEDYRTLLRLWCNAADVELKKLRWSKSPLTPHCSKLKDLD